MGTLKNYRIDRDRDINMYAVLVTGGKAIPRDAGRNAPRRTARGRSRQRDQVDNILMLGDADGIKLGDALKGATVAAKVVGHGRADKVRIVKFRRRKAPSQTDGPPAAPHRNRDHRHRRRRQEVETQPWHTKGRRFLAQRPRFQPEVPRRQDLRRPGHRGRQHHRPPARHAVPSGQRRRPGRDHTLFALVDGTVGVLDQGPKQRRTVSIVAAE